MILQRPPAQTSRLSPQGRFRIHYDTTGFHQPALLQGDTVRIPNSYEEYVDSVGATLERCWDEEITVRGFTAPPDDNGAGGGNEYDVYIQEVGAGTFGFTSWELYDTLETGARQRYPSHIVLDKDFLGERTPGLNGLRVTAAHEFHHAVQVGSYGIWLDIPSSDFYFYELSAVWMEEEVFDDINDYLFDLPTFFSGFTDGLGRSRAFNTYGGSFRGYERSVWAIFLESRFGPGTMKRIWEWIRERPAIPGMDACLRERGSDLRSAFLEFGEWNLFTAHRARPGVYYSEGASFPVMKHNANRTFSVAGASHSGSASPWSLQYYGFTFPGDTVTAVLARVDQERAQETVTQPFTVSVSVTSPFMPAGSFLPGLSWRFSGEDADGWRVRYVSLATGENSRVRGLPAPNPVVLSNGGTLSLPADDIVEPTALISVLTPSLDLVYSSSYPVAATTAGRVVVVPISDLASRISSGVHFFHVSAGGRERTWKIVLVQ